MLIEGVGLLACGYVAVWLVVEFLVLIGYGLATLRIKARDNGDDEQ